ncbi:MAG: glycosyl transferase, partial [Leptospiraceae bacterium]|nr:glycosyl transferase [Leptospiraceae bacterium]
MDQFCAGFATGDAISNEALILQDFLQRFGIASTIYSQHFNENDAHLVRHYKEYRDDRNSILIYHHSFYSDFLKQLKYLRSRRILVFHNMTPPEYVQPYNREIAEQL